MRRLPGRPVSDHEPRLRRAEEPRHVVRRNGRAGFTFRRLLRLAEGVAADAGDRGTAAAGHAGVVRGRRCITVSATHDHIYPATGQPNATVSLAGAAEIDHAVAIAQEAQRQWIALTVDRRRDLLIDLADVVHQHLDELSALNVQDYAVPISFAGNAILLERFLRH